ncbi:MAG TPA: hypothetical protein VEM39_04790 [Myxococcaceae bacterium]|nr:hypothetical protein [Myxococcaceae bacterium]
MRAVLCIRLALLLATDPAPDAGFDADSDVSAVLSQARTYFADLLAQRIPEVVEQSETPFYLEGRRVGSRGELASKWTQNLADKRLDLLALYGIEILTPSEMLKRYGNPPSRLSTLPWRRPRTYLAVANISGRATIAVFHRSAAGWRVAGFSD